MPATLDPSTRGRDPELAVVGEALDRVRAGLGAVVVIEGVPGIGKSRMVREAAAMARRLSLRVGIGAAEPSGSVAELAPLLRALFDGPDPLLDRAALGGLRAPTEQRYWLLDDLQSLLERAAMNGPMLVCLDDLQWADSGTAAALQMLPPRLASLPIGWLVAKRPGYASTELCNAVEPLIGDGASRLLLPPQHRGHAGHDAGPWGSA